MFLGLIVVGVGAGIAGYVMTRDDDADPASAKAATARPGVVPRRPGLAARDRADELAAEPGAPAPPPVDLSDVSPGVKKWKEPGLPGTFREIVSADDGENVEEKLTYKMRRLRFQLTDAAADCYQGEDSRQQIALAYTLVVSGGELTVEDVRELDSNIEDRTVENCIVGAVKLLSSTVDVPDVRKEQQTVISLHDLYVRNRSVD